MMSPHLMPEAFSVGFHTGPVCPSWPLITAFSFGVIWTYGFVFELVRWQIVSLPSGALKLDVAVTTKPTVESVVTAATSRTLRTLRLVAWSEVSPRRIHLRVT